MQLFFRLALALLLFMPLPASGQDTRVPTGYIRSDKLQPEFLDLVPQGYVLESPQLVKYGTRGNVSFFAKKEFTGRHSIYFSEYHVDLNIAEVPNQLIRIQGPLYRTQMEQNIKTAMSGRRKDDSDPITGHDQAVLTRYAWGAGITQRIIHKYMGAGTSPDEIDFACEYFGLVIDNRHIKTFKLSVSGVDTRAAADKWAGKVAERISKTGLADLKAGASPKK